MSILDKVRTRETYFDRIRVKSRNTKNATRTAINSFENFCQKNYNHDSDYVLEQLSKLKGDMKENQIFETLQDFINYLNEQNYTAWTVRLTVLRLKPYISYRTMTKIHNEDFKAELNFPKIVKERHESLSRETIKKILEYSSPERRALYLTLLSSALRIGEAVQIRKRDFEVFGQRLKISVRAKYTKTKQERITFISKEAEAHMRPILDRMPPDKLVFGTNEDPFQAMQNEETYFLRLRQRAGFDEKYDSGVSKVTIHALRSYFITKCEKMHEGLGHALAGHDRYMKEYERFSDQELLEFYLKAEPELIISDEERLQIQGKIKDEKISKLESEKDKTISDLQEMTRNLSERLQKQESMTAEINKIQLEIKETLNRESDPSNPHHPDGGPFDTRLVNLEMKEINDKSMVIFDTEFEERIEVVLQKDKVYCTLDKSSACKHVLFALGNSDFYQLVKKHDIDISFSTAN